MEITASTLFSAGIGALQSGQRRVDQAAAQVAGAAAQQGAEAAAPADLTQDLVDLRVGQHQAQVGARLVKTADEVLGTLLDTRA